MKVGDFITFSGCYQIEVGKHRRFEMNTRRRKGVVVKKSQLDTGELKLRVFSENQFCILNALEKDCAIQVLK